SGASPRQVDDALEAFGFAMGPFAMSDLAGIDVSEAGRRTFRVTADPVLLASQSDIPTKLYEAGRYGQKTGAGFYRYVEGDRTRYDDPAVEAIIEECAAASGVTRRTVTDEEIVERCVLALVNEAAKLLEDGIAQRASDVDVVWVAGYNFPAFRGGPLFWADQQGLDHVVARMREFQETLGEYWRPAELLVRTAEAGATMVRLVHSPRPAPPHPRAPPTGVSSSDSSRSPPGTRPWGGRCAAVSPRSSRWRTSSSSTRSSWGRSRTPRASSWAAATSPTSLRSPRRPPWSRDC